MVHYVNDLFLFEMYYVFLGIPLLYICTQTSFVFFVSYFVSAIVLLFVAYPVLHLRWIRTPAYRKLAFSSQMFVVANTIQYCWLQVLSIPALYLLVSWESAPVRTLLGMYIIPTLVSLCMLDESFLVVMHHVTAVGLFVLSHYVPLRDTGIMYCVSIYGLTTCLSAPVYNALAQHRLDDYETLYESRLIFWNYVGVCGLNWGWQVYYLATNDMSLTGVMWVCCLVIFVNQNVQLLWWLNKKKSV